MPERVIPPVPEDFQYQTGTVEYLDQNPVTTTATAPVEASGGAAGLQSGGTNGAVDPFTATFNTSSLDELSLQQLVEIFVTYAFIIAGALSALFIFIGGISFILSGGNDEKIKQAVNTIRYSIIGLIVTILSFTFVTIVGRIFGLDFMSYLSYGKIRDSINTILTPANQNDNSSFEIQGSHFQTQPFVILRHNRRI